MSSSYRFFSRSIVRILPVLAGVLLAACQTEHAAKTTPPAAPTAPSAPMLSVSVPPPMTTTPPAPVPAPVVVAPPPAPAPAAVAPVVNAPTIRIAAGASMPFTDSAGNLWQADTGFEGGDTTPRDAGMAIAGTKDAGLFHNEHYSMTGFTQKLPNGKYTVNLYFAETYPEGVNGPGDRVFSMNVGGVDVKDFDVWAKAGAAQKAFVLSNEVTVTNGELKITFTAGTQNPEINGVEIIPHS